MKTHLVLLLTPILLLDTLAESTSWPEIHGHARASTYLGDDLIDSIPEGGPPKLWEVELNAGFGGASIDHGQVFVMDRIPSEADLIRCFNLETGEEEWSFRYEIEGRLGFSGSRNVPTVAGDYVYTTGGFGQVHCLDRATGEKMWAFDTMEHFSVEMPPNWGYAQSPLLVNGNVIIGVFSDEVGLAALDLETGDVVWQTEPMGTSMSQPAAIDIFGEQELLIISKLESSDGGDETGQLTSIAIDSGETNWKSDLYYNKWPIPVPHKVTGDRLFFTGGYECGSLMAKLVPGGIEEVYRLPGGSQIQPPIVVGDHLYLMLNENANYKTKFQREESGGLACLELATGKEVWRTGNAPYFGRGNIILSGNKLIIQDGHSGVLRMVAATPASYQLLGSAANVFQVEDPDDDSQMWSPMALADGRLIMRGQGQLICLDLRK